MPSTGAALPFFTIGHSNRGLKDFIVLLTTASIDRVVDMPVKVAYIDAEAWKDIYGHRVGKGEVPKDPQFYENASGVSFYLQWYNSQIKM